MSIDTIAYYFNKTMHVELATEINMLATQKQVSVSRWVNNSNGRQIVTYIVHTGERNQFASKQENVLFQTSLDAGRGNRVKDETGMMNDVLAFLNGMIVDNDSDQFEITSDLIGDSEPATESEIDSMVAEWDYPGWELSVQRNDDEIRVYAERTHSDDWTPTRYTNWTMVTDDMGYIVVAERLEVANV